MVAASLAAAALICLDPGHGTPPAIGAQTEPIGPGSHVTKIKDGGGFETGTQGLAVAACVRWYSSDVIVGLTLLNAPASPTGGPSGGLSR